MCGKKWGKKQGQLENTNCSLCLTAIVLPPHLPKMCRAGFCNALPFTWQKKCLCGLIPPSLPSACVPLPQGCSVVLAEACRYWNSCVFLEWCGLVRCHMLEPPVLSAKMAAWFQRIYPTSKSGQREHEMKLCILHSALDCCSATDLSDTSACQLHSYCTNHQIPNYCNWCCDAIYTCFLARNSETSPFPRSVPDDSGLRCSAVAGEFQLPVFAFCQSPLLILQVEQIPVLWNVRGKWVLGWKAVVLGLTGSMGSGVSLCGIACDTLSSMFLWFLDFVSTRSAILI